MDDPGFEFRKVQEIFSLLRNVQTGGGAYPTSYSMRTVVLPRQKKRRRRVVEHSPSSSAEVRNEWSYTSTAFIFLHGVDRDNFVFARYYV
jgi:hypothetical protein